MEIFDMGISISSDVIGGAVLLLLISLMNKLDPLARRYLAAGWRWLAPRAAAFAAAHWRKAVIALTVAWAFGGVLAYGLTGGMTDTAPLWAMCWLGSVSLSVWACAAWQGGLAVRWTFRRARRLFA